jgi:hypothetical protein
VFNPQTDLDLWAAFRPRERRCCGARSATPRLADLPAGAWERTPLYLACGSATADREALSVVIAQLRRCAHASAIIEKFDDDNHAGLMARISGGPVAPVLAREAVRLIHDGDTVATGGFVGIGFAEGVAVALESASWPSGHRQPARPDAGLRRRPGRRRPRPQPLGPRRPGARVIGGHWGLVPEAAGAGGGQPHRGLEPAAGRDLAPVPRHRRRQAGHADPGRPGHLRRPAPRRRPHQRTHHRGAGAR